MNDEGVDVRRLVEVHMPVVSQVVGRLLVRLPAQVDRDDLMSAGHMALVQAAQAFDPSRGVPFEPFARVRVRGAVIDELRTMDWASRSVRRRSRELDAARQRLSAELGRQPSELELATDQGLEVADVRANRHDVERADLVALPAPGEGVGGAEPISTERDPAEQLIELERLDALHEAIAALPEKHRHVVQSSFLGQLPLAEIAAELGVTESRVSQLRSESVRMLAAAMQELVGEVQEQGAGRVQRKTQLYVASIRADREQRRMRSVARTRRREPGPALAC